MLKDIIKSMEQSVGNFSHYKVTTGEGEDIPFEDKPAQQFLKGLGVLSISNAKLSTSKSGKPLKKSGNPNVTILSFDNRETKQLKITGARVDELMASAKIYVNTDILPEGLYAEALVKKYVVEQDQSMSPSAKKYWQNMAVGVCHAQKIDLLVEHRMQDGRAISGPREGVINQGDLALLLLSTPALNIEYGVGRKLTTEQRIFLIEGMYRNLFQATLNEGYNYIALPAAGLGAFGGNPDRYFSSLMNVAAEFPNLNIIFNAVRNPKTFDKHWKKTKPNNVVQTTKDVVFVADALTRDGKPCALHNPADCDSVYGVYDIGEYWKNGKDERYVGEEHIGSMTTAPLNSSKLNPQAYKTIQEWGFSKKYPENNNPKSVSFFKTIQSRIQIPPYEEGNYLLSKKQFGDIESAVQQLDKEINSFWPYPNKDLKRLKVTALLELIENSRNPTDSDKDLGEIIADLIAKYPNMLDGSISTRTAKLIDRLEDDAQKQNKS